MAKNYDFNIFVVLGDANDANDAKAWADEKGLSNLAMFYEKEQLNTFQVPLGKYMECLCLVFSKKEKWMKNS